MENLRINIAIPIDMGQMRFRIKIGILSTVYIERKFYHKSLEHIQSKIKYDLQHKIIFAANIKPGA